MPIREKRKFMPGLTLAALLCLNSCKAGNYNQCPVYPVAGPAVASELRQAEYEKYPQTWEWIGRINKLRQELELCR